MRRKRRKRRRRQSETNNKTESPANEGNLKRSKQAAAIESRKKEKIVAGHQQNLQQWRSFSLLFALVLIVAAAAANVRISSCDKAENQTTVMRSADESPSKQKTPVIANYKPQISSSSSGSKKSNNSQDNDEDEHRNLARRQFRRQTHKIQRHSAPVYGSEGNRSLRGAAVAAGGAFDQEKELEVEGDDQEERQLIEIEAGQTGVLSCHLFQAADSHANVASNPVQQQHSVVDNLVLTSLDEGQQQRQQRRRQKDESSSSSLFLSQARSNHLARDQDDWLVSLVFWYKDDNPSPIYTLDARHHHNHQQVNQHSLLFDSSSQVREDKSSSAREESSSSGPESELANLLAGARHYSANEIKYKLDTRKGNELLLLIYNTSASDTGNYKCRVDFRRWPTQSQVMKLLVKVPISRPEIIVKGRQLASDEGELELELEEQQEGVELTCFVRQGSPKPTLNWLLELPNFSSNNTSGPGSRTTVTTVLTEGVLIGQETTDESDSIVVALSKLRLARVGREWQNARLGCQASQQLAANHGKSQSANSVAVGEKKLLKADNKMIDDDSSRNSNKAATDTTTTNTLAGSGSTGKPGGQHDNEVPPSSSNGQQVSRLTEWVQLRLKLKPTKIEIVLAAAESRNRFGPAEPSQSQSQVKQPVKLIQEKEHLWLAEFDELSWSSSSLAEVDEQLRKFNELLVCQSSGSWPPAKLVWSSSPDNDAMGSSHGRIAALAGGQTTTTAGESTTISRSWLKLTPIETGQTLAIDRQLDGVEFVCLASNEHLSMDLRKSSTLEARLRLSVRYKPSVRLVKEEQNNKEKVALKCIVQSNPPINQLVWLVNGQPLAKIMPSQTSTPANLSSFGSNPPSEELETSANPPTAAATDRRTGKGMALLEQSWRITGPKDSQRRELNHNGKQYRLEGPDKLVLVVNKDYETTNTDLLGEDSYKCLAINIMGQQESEPLGARHNYRPVCLPISLSATNDTTTSSSSWWRQRRRPDDDKLMLLLDLSKSAHSSTSFGELAALGKRRLACPVHSQPLPVRVNWSFIGLEELLQLANLRQENKLNEMIGELDQSARWHLETNYIDNDNTNNNIIDSSIHGSLELDKLPNKRQPGILLCRAANSLGWQAQPCLTLMNLASKLDLTSRGAPNCSLRARTSKHQHKRLWIEVNCHQVKQQYHEQKDEEQQDHEEEEMILQLDISSKQETRRVLFSSRNLPHQITNLPSLEQILATSANMSKNGTRRRDDGAAGNDDDDDQGEQADEGTKRQLQIPTTVTSDKKTAQLDSFLQGLVFTLRATNLVSTSEPRSIYGRDLQLVQEEARSSDGGEEEEDDQTTQDGALSSSGQQQQQVLRSATSEQLLNLDSPIPSAIRQTNHLASTGQSQMSPQSSISTTISTSTQQQQQQVSGKGGHEYEINIAIAAIAGTCVLSLLTLTLIVLLLKNSSSSSSSSTHRQPGDTAGEQSAGPWLSDNLAAKVQGYQKANSMGSRQPAIWKRLLLLKPATNAANTNTSSATTTTATTITTAAGSDTVDSQLEMELRPGSIASSTEQQQQQPLFPLARLIIREELSPSSAIELPELHGVNFLAPAKVRTASCSNQVMQQYGTGEPPTRLYALGSIAAFQQENDEDETTTTTTTVRHSSHLSLLNDPSLVTPHLHHLHHLHHQTEQLYVIEDQQQQEQVPSANSTSSTSSSGAAVSAVGGHYGSFHRQQICQQQQHRQRANSCCCSPATCDSSSLHCDELMNTSLGATSNNSQSQSLISHQQPRTCQHHHQHSGLSAAFAGNIENEDDDGRTLKTKTSTNNTTVGQEKLGDNLFLFSFL